MEAQGREWVIISLFLLQQRKGGPTRLTLPSKSTVSWLQSSVGPGGGKKVGRAPHWGAAASGGREQDNVVLDRPAFPGGNRGAGNQTG